MRNSTRTFALVATLAVSLPAFGSEAFTLEQVLKLAVLKARSEEARVAAAQGNLQCLETQGKTRVELRPLMGLMAFSNPFWMAGNFGAGLLMNRRTAPNPVVVRNARLDVLDAEIAAEATRVRAEIEATRAFFGLMEKQRLAEHTRQALAERQGRGKQIEQMLRTGAITVIDRGAYEQEMLDVEMQAIDADTERDVASRRLAAMIGAQGMVRVSDTGLEAISWDRPIPPIDSLVQNALAFRGETRAIRSRIEVLRKELDRERKAGAGTQGGFGDRVKSALLNGNALFTEPALGISLRKTGEKEAAAEWLSARVKTLELELEAIEDAVRNEVVEMQTRVTASQAKYRVAERKLQLARQSRALVSQRFDNGLASPAVASAAERALLDAEAAFLRADSERKTGVLSVRVLCGSPEGRETAVQSEAGL